jgi:tetratricopeptide (TPR) repeat protein
VLLIISANTSNSTLLKAHGVDEYTIMNTIKMIIVLFLLSSDIGWAAQKILFSEGQSIHAHTARILLKHHNWDRAIEELKSALHDHPNNPKIAVKLAQLYYKKGEVEKSLELLLPLQKFTTKQMNIFYYLGLMYDKLDQNQNAYLYYAKAFKVDPTLYVSKLRIARLFIKKKLYYDAAIHLKTLLEINPDYKDARDEFELTLNLIKNNESNVFRRGNMVITFPDYNMIRDIEDWYPYLQEKVYYMQNALGCHDEVVWVEIVKEIKSPHSPPAIYNSLNDKIYLTIDTMKRKYTSLFAHELTYFFFHKMGIKKAPKWLQEGVALYFAQPNLLKTMTLRRLGNDWDILGQKFYEDKRYLHFESLSDEERKNLFHAFLIAKYIIQKYGWQNLEKFAKTFESGRTRVEEAIWDVFHIHYRKLMMDFDTYVTVNHFFNS